MATLANALHPWKAHDSMLVTDEGMAMLVNALHNWKAKIPMLVTDVGMATLANALHPEKAQESMWVTDVGMATLANALHPSNAPSSMLVTDVGIVMLVTSTLFTPHSINDPMPMRAVPAGTLKCPSGSIVLQQHCYCCYTPLRANDRVLRAPSLLRAVRWAVLVRLVFLRVAKPNCKSTQ